ncbi:MAG: bifunctional 2-polyprenyl-6-hydroxyphenol methylase/3-demethylubiquinol 3-O-methyltransferase UbiG [Pseudomonadales bacterium]|jgi:2-polyprenyl-6-hydroxyphenyl methylase/3-demethylubiquinone-9 3-methyltransferase|nr:bifunctional 2-polyprenyl-6-hydroxyphenol methylase/3-demethylubiquinol 3-O-methyltransferase UbiG [Pseudomonadales bacterium]
MANAQNVDPEEISKFNALASRWWDLNGDFKALHDINPSRLNYIQERTELGDGPVIDVGCGGGILAESLAAAGAQTTGIDMATKALGVAKLHALDSEIQVNYVETTAEEYAALKPAHFRTVTCLEMLEHVTHYPDTIKACADLAQPGGDLFFSTINRNPKAYLLLVLGAEYLLNILPKGTHEYAKFIKPSELAQGLRDAGLELVEIRGMNYNPLSRNCRISNDTDANYIVHARKPQ